MENLIIEKGKIRELLDNAPDSIIIEDFIDQIIISAKIEKALDQLDKGQFLTSEQLDEEIEKWWRKYNQPAQLITRAPPPACRNTVNWKKSLPASQHSYAGVTAPVIKSTR